jgi:excisionase family DNA binding protein
MGADTGQTEEIMSTRDAAQLLGVSVRTVQLWVESGNLDAWKTPGGHRRIYRNSVSRMLAARSTPDSGVQSGENHYDILICEDSSVGSTILELQLKSLGPEVRIRTVHSGYEALLKIGESCPDLLLMDLVASNSNNIQMLDALNNTSFTQTMHIVVLTDLDDAELKKLGGLHPGVTKFNKPAPFTQILRLLRVYMDIRNLS